MEDTSYVSLSLKKYNELYDKSKQYDKWLDLYGENIKNLFNELFDNSSKLLSEKKVSVSVTDEGNHIPSIDSNFNNKEVKEEFKARR